MILENARSAARALRTNRLRSALTMLGIIIGGASLIAMVAVGAGAQARVREQIQTTPPTKPPSSTPSKPSASSDASLGPGGDNPS